MDDPIERLLGRLTAEPMPLDLTDRVRFRLAQARRRERLQEAIGRGSVLALGVGSGILLWPALASLAGGWTENLGSLAESLMRVLNDPVAGLWAMVQANLTWGPEVLHGLGTVGLVALLLLAVPALLALSWTLNGATEKGAT